MNQNISLSFEEMLVVVVNSRLILNTLDEYEDMLDNHSIHNNGIKRCFNTVQKIRSAFRDFQVETLCQTDEYFDLADILERYKKAWEFYKLYLSRRKNPESYILDMLNYIYSSDQNTIVISQSKVSIFQKIEDKRIDVPFLFLMLLKIIPGFDSKEGDVHNINAQFDFALNVLERFTGTNTTISLTPVYQQAREEQHKTRLMLLYHVTHILDAYYSTLTSNRLYEQSVERKQNSVVLDIDGYWNQCSGLLDSTIFYHIQSASNDGSYFVTCWHKDSNNKLTGTRYTLFLNEHTRDHIMAYVQHPQAIMHRIQGIQYVDSDNVWYLVDSPLDISPDVLHFSRLMNSEVWPKVLTLTRVTQKTVIDCYSKWLSQYDQNMLFKDYEYMFKVNLYAATLDFLYIPTEKGSKYYKIPRASFEGLDNIQVGDLAGLMTMGNKEYIVFDDLLLYIEISQENLNKYNIEIVDNIE